MAPAFGKPWGQGGMDPPHGHRSPRVSSAVTSTGLCIPGMFSPSPFPYPAVISASALVTTRRTFHHVCRVPPPLQVSSVEKQDLVCIAPSHTPAPPQDLVNAVGAFIDKYLPNECNGLAPNAVLASSEAPMYPLSQSCLSVSRSYDVSGFLSLWSCEMGIAISSLPFQG